MFCKTLLASLTCCVLISGESFAAAPNGEHISTHLQSILAGPLTRKVKRYHQQQETLYLSRKVTKYRLVLKERLELRRVRVAVPLSEAAYRKENYTVWRPALASKNMDRSDQWLEAQKVRMTPVQINQLTYRDELRYVKCQYYELEAYEDIDYFLVPRMSHVSEFEGVLIPQRKIQKLASQYIDPFSPAILAGFSIFPDRILQPASTQTE
ncbi:MAG: hypothetical protein VXZ38_05695 [Planctomycetota bacterium]|nr:hypothetical protein [Planctomycetota bacterium]